MFILRTTTPPSVQKLLELERTVIVDNAGLNIPAGIGQSQACLVAEFPMGPFGPTIVQSSGDIQNLYTGTDWTKFSLISQGSYNPATGGVDTDGSGVTFDGNGWAELKGKTFSGLVIQRVDCDMVATNGGTAKAFVEFTVTVNSADITSGATNKAIVIPAGTRFSDGASVIIATSQQITIPAGTTCGGSFSCAISFTQNAQTGQLTYVTSGATTGATCFFVKGQTKALAGINTAVDVVLPGVNAGTVIASSGVSTVNSTPAATAVFAPSGGASQGTTLSNCIIANYAAAIDKTLPGNDATNNIVCLWSARNYHATTASALSNLRKKLWTSNAVAASSIGRGRVAMVTAAPCTDLTPTDALTTVFALYTGLKGTDGVTGADADRYWICGPYVQVYSQELAQDITISACGFRAAMKVNLMNAGQSEYLTSVGSPYNQTIQGIDAQEPGFAANPLPTDSYYVTLKADGVAWLVRDQKAGWWFYSGPTAADPITYANRIADNRRSFADEVEDMIFALAAQYKDLPGTTERQDAFASDMRVYLDGMCNPPPGIDARAKQYQVLDGKAAGNTDLLNGQGVFFFSASVIMWGSMGTIMITAAIGPTVVITQVT